MGFVRDDKWFGDAIASLGRHLFPSLGRHSIDFLDPPLSRRTTGSSPLAQRYEPNHVVKSSTSARAVR